MRNNKCKDLVILQKLGKKVKRVLFENKNVEISRLYRVYKCYRSLIKRLHCVKFAKKRVLKYQNNNLSGLMKRNECLVLNKNNANKNIKYFNKNIENNENKNVKYF